jgi:hypothetical protein
MMYYSESTGGFYDEAVHGVRKLTIIVPGWTRPVHDVTLGPGEQIEAELNGEVRLVENTTDELMVVSDVPDMSVEPPILEIDNPDTKIPADAVEITPEKHRELLAGQSEGKCIRADAQRHPILQDPPPPSPNDITCAQILALEKSITDRRVREAILGMDLAGLQASIARLSF